MRRVVIESPFAGDIDLNVEYARAAMHDCLLRGEAPIASHLLYTQPGILDDDVPAERQLGIDAGLIWGELAEATVVYTDRGTSRGMVYGIDRAQSAGRPIEYRSLAPWAPPGPSGLAVEPDEPFVCNHMWQPRNAPCLMCEAEARE